MVREHPTRQGVREAGQEWRSPARASCAVRPPVRPRPDPRPAVVATPRRRREPPTGEAWRGWPHPRTRERLAARASDASACRRSRTPPAAPGSTERTCPAGSSHGGHGRGAARLHGGTRPRDSEGTVLRRPERRRDRRWCVVPSPGEPVPEGTRLRRRKPPCRLRPRRWPPPPDSHPPLVEQSSSSSPFQPPWRIAAAEPQAPVEQRRLHLSCPVLPDRNKHYNCPYRADRTPDFGPFPVGIRLPRRPRGATGDLSSRW